MLIHFMYYFYWGEKNSSVNYKKYMPHFGWQPVISLLQLIRHDS